MIAIEKILFLKRVSIFKSLNSQELRVIAEVTSEEELSTGEILFTEGQPGDCMYFVLEGRIKIFTGILPKIKSLAVFEAGDFFGEMGLYDDKPRAASAMAQETSKLMLLRKADFCELIAEYPDVALGIMKELNQRIRATNVKLTSVEKHLLDKSGNLYSKDYFLECVSIELLKSKKNDVPIAFVAIKILQMRASNPNLSNSHGKINSPNQENFENSTSTNSNDYVPSDSIVELLASELGRIITLHQRPSDIAARFKENKIVIMLGEANKEGAEAFSKRVKKDIEKYLTTFREIKGQKVELDYKLFCFPFDSDERETLITLLEEA
ncbi:MAG: cyclic nucleotide-binding domain-containing protein [Candidatus Riflebacteria bacterium]|nr:cyclic nucleotide-binding domain-containing protein [Candidatus Riflebacteria bacterium]